MANSVAQPSPPPIQSIHPSLLALLPLLLIGLTSSPLSKHFQCQPMTLFSSSSSLFGGGTTPLCVVYFRFSPTNNEEKRQPPKDSSADVGLGGSFKEAAGG